jgi:glucose/arabinose dehydrogenase
MGTRARGPLVRLALALAVAAGALVTPVTPAGPAAAAPRAPAAPTAVPTGFGDRVAIGGLTQPTAVAFAPDGRVFVAEKSGIVKSFDSLADTTATVFADLRTQVHNHWDRGLLGLALDPRFPTRPYVYVVYTYDAEPGGTAPRWGSPGGTSDGCPDPPGATALGCVVQARLSRLTADGDRMVGPERVLVSGWCQQFPSHSVGSVAFGPDGALYAGAGDGASFNYVDYGQTRNPCGDPPAPAGTSLSPPAAEGGSLRSQSVRRAAGQPVTLDGTIVRVDPDTGAGMPGNPFASSADANARRIIAYGLRNPFRFGLRPGTDQLWVGDVGWSTWEELNRVADVNDGVAENFGWPCYEGAAHQGGYDGANLTRCETLYGGSGGTPTPPHHAYRHDAKVVATDACPVGSSAVSGIAFEAESNYPAAYDGALFFSDAARGCIWAMQRSGADPSPSRIVPFVSGANQVVQVVTGPGGDVFYVAMGSGQLRRVSYDGANHPPTAAASATPTSGVAPLTVAFDGRDSHDLDPGDTLRYAWDLDGDGQYDDATAATASRTYTAEGTVTAGLRVTDTAGASHTQALTITIGPPNTPPVPVIDTPTSALRWRVGDTISFAGHATDAEDGTLAPARLSWSVVINHCPSNCHTHPLQDFPGVAGGRFPAIDHEYPSSLSLALTATDSAGVSATTTLRLDPQTVDLRFESAPSGLQLDVGPASVTTPATRPAIVGSSNSVSAPSPQTVGGTRYAFESWSDGGAATHNIVAPAAPATYTATYREVRTGCPATPSHFHTMPIPAGPPAAAPLPDGRVAFGSIGGDGQLYLAAADITGDPIASGPLECHSGLSGVPGSENPAVAAGPGYVGLFARGTDGRIQQRFVASGSPGAWAPLPVGGTASAGPAATVTVDGVVHLVIRGTNGAVYHAARRGGTWTGWENLGGGVVGAPAVAPWPGGGIAIFARATNDSIYVLRGETGIWTPWTRMAGTTRSSPTVAWGYAPGRVDLFFGGTLGGLYQQTYSGGAWGGVSLRVDTVPLGARVAAAARSWRVVVYSAAGGSVNTHQYAGTWLTRPAAYTCDACVPAARSGPR